MAKLLLFGFGPFLSYLTNPTKEIVESLNGQRIGGSDIVGVVLPVEHGKAGEIAEDYISREKPDSIVQVGIAGGKGCVSLERVALNRYYFVGDEGVIDEPVLKDGPVGYFSTLPLQQIKSSLESNDIPAEYSFWADTYVSNEVFYRVMRAAGQDTPAGLVHLPISSKQVIERKAHYMVRSAVPSMDPAMLAKAVRIVVETCANME